MDFMKIGISWKISVTVLTTGANYYGSGATLKVMKRSGCRSHKNIVVHSIGSLNKMEERTLSMEAFSKGNGCVSHGILLREIWMHQP